MKRRKNKEEENPTEGEKRGAARAADLQWRDANAERDSVTQTTARAAGEALRRR